MRYIPTVIEKTGNSERAYDLYSRLLKDRIVMLTSEVTDSISANIVAQLLFLDSKNSSPIYFYINSPGGAVTAGLSIYDTMQYVNSPIHTICMGQACSMGALLLCGGHPGHRYSLPNSRIMIHQPLGGTRGQVSDMTIAVKESLRIKQLTANIMAAHTNKELKTIHRDTDRDNFMTPTEALEYGLIDEIIKNK